MGGSQEPADSLAWQKEQAPGSERGCFKAVGQKTPDTRSGLQIYLCGCVCPPTHTNKHTTHTLHVHTHIHIHIHCTHTLTVHTCAYTHSTHTYNAHTHCKHTYIAHTHTLKETKRVERRRGRRWAGTVTQWRALAQFVQFPVSKSINQSNQDCIPETSVTECL